MPSLLYITPYFPPQSRVGAWRPLKFVRHLRAFGWEPRVWTDFPKGAATDASLLEHLPPDLPIDYSWSSGARTRHARWLAGGTGATTRPRTPNSKPRTWFDSPELIPFGEHLFDMAHALRRGRELLRAHRPDAMLVNMDPFAGAEVGRRLSREFGVPLVLDFRDPWAWCDLRRPIRPWPSRLIVDRYEGKALEVCRAAIFNSANTVAVYRERYPDLAHKFHFIRNFHDAELMDHGTAPVFEAPTVVMMGNLRRFIEGTEYFEALAVLKVRGVGPDRIRFAQYGQVLPDTPATIARFGVEDYVMLGGQLPYNRVLPVLKQAAGLLIPDIQGTMRLPSKFFDYVVAGRPMLAFDRNPELNAMVTETGGLLVSPGQPEALADALLRLAQSPPGPAISDDLIERYSARTATRELVHILKSVI